jgi:hypothetical protein
MMREMHHIAGKLMDGENYFIALYDSTRKTLRLAYFADIQGHQHLRSRNGYTRKRSGQLSHRWGSGRQPPRIWTGSSTPLAVRTPGP